MALFFFIFGSFLFLKINFCLQQTVYVCVYFCWLTRAINIFNVIKRCIHLTIKWTNVRTCIYNVISFWSKLIQIRIKVKKARILLREFLLKKWNHCNLFPWILRETNNRCVFKMHGTINSRGLNTTKKMTVFIVLCVAFKLRNFWWCQYFVHVLLTRSFDSKT